jgi:competence protein ComGC
MTRPFSSKLLIVNANFLITFGKKEKQVIKKFSIIEMMTVVLIVLLLMSLTIPLFITLKMNARNAICKNQLRQIGVLMTSYASTYNGNLPNDDSNDITRVKYPNSDLYFGWNGHLLPFIDTSLKNYERAVKVDSAGVVRWTKQQPVNLFPTNNGILPPPNPLQSGWAVIDDAYKKGGYNDLKIFICPEIHGNTYDVAAHTIFGQLIPRLKLAQSGSAYADNFIWTLGGGTPTTYIANGSFFGKNQLFSNKAVNSLRVDEFADISHKVFLMEGGFTYSDTYGGCSEIYIEGGDYTTAYDLALQPYRNHFTKAAARGHKLSFVHDSYGAFWSTFGDTVSANWTFSGHGMNCSQEVANQFNTMFEGKAYLLPKSQDGAHRGYHIISFVDPYDVKPSLSDMGQKYKKFFTDKGIASLTNYELYDEPEFHYLVGSANLLFGDGAVDTKSQSWLYNNRDKIARLTKE